MDAALNTILDNYKENEVVAFDANSNISFLGCGMALCIGNQISVPEGLFYSNKETLEKKVALRMVYHKDTKVILGTQLCSDHDISLLINFFSLAIQQQVTIDQLKLFDVFFLPHFN